MKQLSPLTSLLILASCFGFFVSGALFLYQRERKKPANEVARTHDNSNGSPSEFTPNLDASQDVSRMANEVKIAPVAPVVESHSTDLVGSDACERCHAGIVASYKKHPMYFGATRLIKDDSPKPPNSSELFGRLKTLMVESSNDQMIHTEMVKDALGAEIYHKQHAMTFVVGSGRRAKAYVEQRENLLCLSPLNWFGKTESWGLNPGYSVDDPRGFDRKALANCLLCHTGEIRTLSPHSDLYQSEPFGEMSIGCERCHGAGKSHIAFHESGAKGPDPIINPESLDEPARQAVCYQCHLQPSTSRILREGRSHQDFQPGMRLDDVWLVVDTENGVDANGRTKSVRHVQQMHDSQCFKKSGTMRCTTCHDPHSIPSPSERLEFYRNACIKCHTVDDGGIGCSEANEQRSRVGDSCFECHMPSRELDLSSHASQTDHRIVRKPGDSSLPGSPSSSTLPFFGDLSDSVSDASRRRALAIYQIRNQGPTSELYREFQSLASVFPNDGMTMLSYGLAAMSQGSPKVAMDAWLKAADREESQEYALEALVQLSRSMAVWDKTIEFAERLIGVNPYHSSAYSQLADALYRTRRAPEAVSAATKAVELDPLSLAAYQTLVDAYSSEGNREKALFWRTARDRLAEKLKQAR